MSGWNELSGLVEIRPLSESLPEPTERARFTASWTDTIQLLAREVAHLKPKRVILEAAFRDQDLRLDGMPRASARTEHDGVILSLLGTKFGIDLRYPCATYDRSAYGSDLAGWQTNVRAIALALEALRAVDRYGVTKRGEQYAGWKQIESPQSRLVSRGREILAEHGGDKRRAMAATHPDAGGDAEDFKAVTAALGAGE